jgi:Spy/CpxP family protein refolding chaperone
MTNTSLRTTLYAFVIFVAGLIAGTIVSPRIHHSLMRHPDSANVADHVLGKLTHQLDLTDAQKVQIKPIVQKTGEAVDGIWHETANRVADRIEQGDREIGSVLTPEQQPKLEAMIAENRGRMREHQPDRHHHPPR